MSERETPTDRAANQARMDRVSPLVVSYGGGVNSAAMVVGMKERGIVPAPVALVALGGYGRGELSPLSDVDVMFLFPTKTKPAEAKPLQEHLTNEILYILWDCGLKVGHSTRTLDEAFEMITWNDIGLHRKATVFLDIEGFWTPVLAVFDHLDRQGMLRAHARGAYDRIRSVAEMPAAASRHLAAAARPRVA